MPTPGSSAAAGGTHGKIAAARRAARCRLFQPELCVVYGRGTSGCSGAWHGAGLGRGGRLLEMGLEASGWPSIWSRGPEVGGAQGASPKCGESDRPRGQNFHQWDTLLCHYGPEGNSKSCKSYSAAQQFVQISLWRLETQEHSCTAHATGLAVLSLMLAH